ncbi:MAG: hypothetical protein ACI4HL_01070 [Ruminococcus sp.]
MARTTIKLAYKDNADKAYKTATSILMENGFKEISRNGETVWKKGTGLLSAMKFVKLELDENSIILSAWVQAGLGSAGGSEMALDGVVLAVPKKSLMKVIEQIKFSL